MKSLRVTTVEHSTFNKPFEAPDGLTCVIQLPFHITEADYLILKGRPGRLSTWANGLLAGSAGQAILLAAKPLLALARNQKVEIPRTEVAVLALTLAIGIVLMIVNRFVDERRPLMRKMTAHFKQNPPALGTVHNDDK